MLPKSNELIEISPDHPDFRQLLRLRQLRATVVEVGNGILGYIVTDKVAELLSICEKLGRVS